ncbi:L,D-transpeptidase [Verrucomicrobiaceae bacterium N1E253]|uniref:L,D-transpeptidase n=1 Tax=Oceaniferula marina TaxID=2748318 RepID=A0A851GHI1_9BACT|nr:L,D-transpeptidase [Oceaniferula marina]NWK54060.1 L,D-transpeptidase [Oceaniferula marina]
MPIRVSIRDQRLRLFSGSQLVREYVISSAANGTGFEEGSYCTPMGRFEISEMIGAEEPEGTIFRAREAVGLWDGSSDGGDLVLSRILWLHGLDADNANTKSRYIYIHGTNHEDRLGIPASCGCIRMSNEDVIDLFDRVQPGERVEIL